MTKLRVRVGRQCFRIFDHAFNWLVGAIRRSMVHIHAFKLDVEGADILGVKPDNVLSDGLDFGFSPLLLLALLGS